MGIMSMPSTQEVQEIDLLPLNLKFHFRWFVLPCGYWEQVSLRSSERKTSVVSY